MVHIEEDLEHHSAHCRSPDVDLHVFRAGVSALTTAETQAQEDAAADPAKRLRNLQKKLRQVQQLKDKQAAGAVLEPEQLQKIASEAALLEDIRAVEGQS